MLSEPPARLSFASVEVTPPPVPSVSPYAFSAVLGDSGPVILLGHVPDADAHRALDSIRVVRAGEHLIRRWAPCPRRALIEAEHDPRAIGGERDARGGAVVDPGPLGERLEHAQHGALETGYRA